MTAASDTPCAIREHVVLDVATTRREVFDSRRPAVLRGLVADWQVVARGRESSASLLRYLRQFDNGTPVDALLTPPEIDGQLFYNAAMTGFNFVRNRLPLSAVADQALRYSSSPTAPSVAVQSASTARCLPGFSDANPLALLEHRVDPRIWLGNRITTPTHVDEWNNVGCVVAGHRRFTLFPPGQIGNLYIGPLDFAPTGAPMSLVSLRTPDFERHPHFRAALAQAEVATLGPGDAIYIPPLWWHHVESLDAFNVLVNYWWDDRTSEGADADSAFDALLHAIVAIRGLPTATRHAWGDFFEHYVFGDPEESVRHIPVARRGVLGALSDEHLERLRQHLAEKLGRNATR